MAAVLLRRSMVTIGLTALATVASPLAGLALSAPSSFASTGITTQPPPDSSKVVPANRPTVKASFNQNLAGGSTITLTEKGQSTNLCTSFQVSGKVVSCTPAADLSTTKKYDATGHGVNSHGDKADTAQLEFTVDYPVFQPDQSNPIPGGSVIDGSETLTATFNEAVGPNSSTPGFRVFEYDASSGRGDSIPGTITYGADLLGSSDGTVNYKANSALSQGEYEAVIFVDGLDSNGADNPNAHGSADYLFWVNNAAPANLHLDKPFANNQNDTDFPFSGTAAPGLTVTVTVPTSSSNPIDSDATGSAVVPPCGTAPACPWTVKVDISGLPDNNDQSWSAQAKDSANKTTPSTEGPHFVKDTTKPAQPTVTAPTISGDSKTVTLSATDSSTDVISYLVTIQDQDNHSITPELNAPGGNLQNGTIDVTTLDDGDLAIWVQARDNHGNLSDKQSTAFHVTKDQGLAPNLGTSKLTTRGVDTSFIDAMTHPVQTPGKVTLEFTQPIKPSRTTGFPNTSTQRSTMCISTPNGNCTVTGTVTFTDDGRGMSLDVPNGALVEGHRYGITATALSKNNCPNGTAADPSPACEKFDGLVRDPATGTVFTFTVDDTAPAVVVSAITPSPIKAASAANVSVSGTVSPDAQTVQLVLTSSGGPGTRVAPATITQSATPGALASWSATGLDLSSLPDGRLTVKAKATDAAGNVGKGTGHARLRAHLSRLTEKASSHRIRFGKAVTVSGRLTDQNGDGITSATITVQSKYADGTLGKPATAVTDGNGRWSLLQAPKHNATFVASYEGSNSSTTHASARTVGAPVLVHALVKVTAPTDTASPTTTVKGKVMPNEKGRTVKVFRKTGHGRTLLGRDTLNKRSRFAVRAHLPSGTVRIFAKIAKTASNLGARSQTVTLHVS